MPPNLLPTWHRPPPRHSARWWPPSRRRWSPAWRSSRARAPRAPTPRARRRGSGAPRSRAWARRSRPATWTSSRSWTTSSPRPTTAVRAALALCAAARRLCTLGESPPSPLCPSLLPFPLELLASPGHLSCSPPVLLQFRIVVTAAPAQPFATFRNLSPAAPPPPPSRLPRLSAQSLVQGVFTKTNPLGEPAGSSHLMNPYGPSGNGGAPPLPEAPNGGPEPAGHAGYL